MLFISYGFSGEGVGLQRVKYWLNNLFDQSDGAITCDLLVASEAEDVSDTVAKIIVVPDSKKSGLLSPFIKDEGLSWKYDIREALENRNDLAYDVVIMSGSPFMHFALSPYLKKKFGAKVILDFRDPFAENPRFDSSKIKIAIKRYYEETFINAVDHVVTVNNTCLGLLSTYSKNTNAKFSIIPNGYDDQALDSLIFEKAESVSGQLRFCYPGKFYNDCKPNLLLSAICNKDKGSFQFEYAGQDYMTLDEFKTESNFKIHGPQPYSEVLQMVNRANIGLIFTGGKPFESTTKIYDYIALEKAIVIITEGEEMTGELHEITKNYPKVFWCKNTVSDINSLLQELSKEDLSFNNSSKEAYSRKAGLEKLIKLINK